MARSSSARRGADARDSNSACVPPSEEFDEEDEDTDLDDEQVDVDE